MHGYRHALAAAVVFSGLPFAWYLRNWLGRDEDRAFSIALLAVALLLVIHWGRLLKGNFYASALTVLLPFMFVWPAMLMASFSGRPGDISALYLAFVGAFFLATLTLPRYVFLTMPTAFFDIAVVVALLSIVQLMLFGTALIENDDVGSRLFAGDSNNPNYLAFAAGLGLVAAFGEIGRWSSAPLARRFSWQFGIPLLIAVCLLAGTRSVLLGFGLCIIALALERAIAPKRMRTVEPLQDRRLGKTRNTWTLLCMWVFMGALISALLGDVLVASMERLVSGTVSGFDVYVAGGLREVDESAETRAILREQALSEFNIWGHGYDALYVDAPVLQAFFDLGLLGGLVFLVVVLIVPIGWSVLNAFRGTLAREQRFPLLVYLFLLPNLLLHGRPYDFSVWLPVMLIYAAIAKREFVARPPIPR